RGIFSKIEQRQRWGKLQLGAVCLNRARTVLWRGGRSNACRLLSRMLIYPITATVASDAFENCQ
ncbi:MAG: hypothetical protein LBJ89_02290, partial [Holosporales bacterium]|nr:hypothetical protein [Holosporales bacterium]